MNKDRTVLGTFMAAAPSEQYTIDAVIVMEDSLAYAVGYDASDGSYVVLKGEDGAQGIVYNVERIYGGLAQSLETITRVAEGQEI
jgi:hypothetical protein